MERQVKMRYAQPSKRQLSLFIVRKKAAAAAAKTTTNQESSGTGAEKPKAVVIISWENGKSYMINQSILNEGISGILSNNKSNSINVLNAHTVSEIKFGVRERSENYGNTPSLAT